MDWGGLAVSGEMGVSFSLREQIEAPTDENFLSSTYCESAFSMLDALEESS